MMQEPTHELPTKNQYRHMQQMFVTLSPAVSRRNAEGENFGKWVKAWARTDFCTGFGTSTCGCVFRKERAFLKRARAFFCFGVSTFRLLGWAWTESFFSSSGGAFDTSSCNAFATASVLRLLS